tara:strand:- start:151 stop:438 length:288 start_codon:yes stop_codon:yes gene_type:complete
MAIVEKTFYSPYVTTYRDVLNPAPVTGVIVDSIQFVAPLAADTIELSVTPLGSESVDVNMSAGDTLYGPFIAYDLGEIEPDETVIVHERDKTITA